MPALVHVLRTEHCCSALKVDQLARRLGQREAHEDFESALVPNDGSCIERALNLAQTSFENLFLPLRAFREAEGVQREPHFVHQGQVQFGKLDALLRLVFI